MTDPAALARAASLDALRDAYPAQPADAVGRDDGAPDWFAADAGGARTTIAGGPDGAGGVENLLDAADVAAIAERVLVPLGR